MARKLYQCIRKCAWYPTPPDMRGQPTSPLHIFDPDDDTIPMGRSLPMSQQYLDPEDPWVKESGILNHFRLPSEVDPEMIESPEQYMARCKKGVRAPMNTEVMERLTKMEPGPVSDKPMHIDSTKIEHANEIGERGRGKSK